MKYFDIDSLRHALPNKFEPLPTGISFDVREAKCYWNGKIVRLSTYQYRTVLALRAYKGRVLSHTELHKLLTSGMPRRGPGPIERTVFVLMRNLRIRFQEVDPEFDEIWNYYGYGYGWRDEERKKAAPGDAGAA